jgi:RNA polymerase sigma factor (sigma-70 family)
VFVNLYSMEAEPSVGAPTSIDDLEAMYRLHYPRFLRVAVALLGDVERGRDAVHEAFVRAIKSLPSYRAEGSLEAWVWRTLVNVCLVEKRHLPARSAYSEEPSADGELAEWPEVRAAITALPERQRTVLFLRYYADLDYSEIGQVLGIARGTVAASLHSARATLRRVLPGEVKR